MSKFLLGGAIVAVLAVGAGLARAPAGQPAPAPAVPDSIAAARLTVADSARLKGPRQPIFFRHDVHAGQYKMQCQYCHYSVGVASEPGIPSMQTCLGCHLAIGSPDSTHLVEIQKLRAAWREQRPVEWIRVHTLARHAHFPHMRHVKVMGPNACGTCHGDVARMPQVYEVNNVNNMGFCVSCHVLRGVNRDCTACHH
jgi:hypothetical protein